MNIQQVKTKRGLLQIQKQWMDKYRIKKDKNKKYENSEELFYSNKKTLKVTWKNWVQIPREETPLRHVP